MKKKFPPIEINEVYGRVRINTSLSNETSEKLRKYAEKEGMSYTEAAKHILSTHLS